MKRALITLTCTAVAVSAVQLSMQQQATLQSMNVPAQLSRLIQQSNSSSLFHAESISTHLKDLARQLRALAALSMESPLPEHAAESEHDDGAAISRSLGESATKERTRTPSNALCHRQLDDSEFCQYEVVCSDGQQFFIHDNGVPFRHHQVKKATTDFLDRPADVAVSDQHFHLTRGPAGLGASVMNVDEKRWDDILHARGDVKTVSWLNNSYITHAELGMTHAWAWASWTVFPVFAARVANESLHLNLPPMDHVVAQHAGTAAQWNNWNRGLMDFALPPGVRVYLTDDLDDMAQRAAGAAVKFGPEHMVCYKNAVLLGHKPFMIGGTYEAEFWRHAVQQKFKLPKQDMSKYLPRRAVILNRKRGGGKKYSRGFHNLDAMVAVLEKYNCTVEVVTFDDPKTRMLEYLITMSRASILISPHGAGLSNLAFMPRRAAVIEIYPYHMWCPLYSRLAANLGLHSFQIFSWLKGPDLNYDYFPRDNPKPPADIAEECDAKSSVEIATGHCYHEYKVGSVNTPIHQFEHTVLNALDLIGHRVWPDEALAMKLDGVPQGGPGEVIPADYNMSYSYDVVRRVG